ncbi:MAG TPA: hypothetical protein VF733_00220 [Candidatus Saccharimonadales bacterium]
MSERSRQLKSPNSKIMPVIGAITLLGATAGAFVAIVPSLVRAPGSVNTYSAPAPPPASSEFENAYNDCSVRNPHIEGYEKGIATIAMDFIINKDPKVAPLEGTAFRYGSAPTASRVVNDSVRPIKTATVPAGTFTYALPPSGQEQSTATLQVAESDIEKWGPTKYRFVVDAYNAAQTKKYELSCGVVIVEGNTYEGLSVDPHNSIPNVPRGQIISIN